MEQEHINFTQYSWNALYKVTLGKAYARFLEGFKNKEIWGNVCPQCNGIHVPARPFCDKCMVVPTEWVQMDEEATLLTFTVTYVKWAGLPDPPNISGVIKIGNSVTNMLHFISGIPYEKPRDLEKKLKIGMKLRPVWKEERTGDIFDIEYFEPVEELP